MKTNKILGMLGVGVLLATGLIFTTNANHSWGNYHWARTANPFTLKLGKVVNASWAPYLTEASNYWTVSEVMDTTIVNSNVNPRNCTPTAGRVEICNAKYGNTNWLGIASVWVGGEHITQGTVKLNDTYFGQRNYNTPAWKRLVMCQEIGHTFGLDHQDENFTNANLGSCMDYTNNPAGPLSNERPNAHDYEQLNTIYSHLDSITTLAQSLVSSNVSAINGRELGEQMSDWGKAIRFDSKNRPSKFEKDLGNGGKIFTFVVWTE